jgi:hypothetical protein
MADNTIKKAKLRQESVKKKRKLHQEYADILWRVKHYGHFETHTFVKVLIDKYGETAASLAKESGFSEGHIKSLYSYDVDSMQKEHEEKQKALRQQG